MSRAVAPHVGVAIATMNRPEALRRCLDGLLEGEMHPAEVIVVDQSRDRATGAMLEARQPLPVRFRYIRQPPRGLSASRNAAVQAATTRVLAFTDDDCVPSGAWVSALHRSFESAGAPDAVTGPILPLGPDAPGLHAVSVRADTARTDYAGRVLPWKVGSGGNTALSREALARVSSFDERLGAGSPGCAAEDVDLLYRLLRSGACIRYEPDAIVYHERQSLERRRRSRPGYGHGMGAFCAKWLRERDLYAAWMLCCWTRHRTALLLRACLRQRWSRAYDEVLMLRGAAAGVLHGLSAGNLPHRAADGGA